MTLGYAESSGGVRIFYAAERGSGVPLLISHAVCSPGASTMMRFEPNLAFNRALANGASWYMYDCRNTGRSSRAEGPITFKDLVDDLEAVAELIGEPFDLYGRRDGSPLAVALAGRRPESVRRLLLVSAQRIAHDWKRIPEYSRRVLRSFKSDQEGTLASHLVFEHPGANPAVALEAAKRHMEAMPLDVMRSHQRAFADTDLRELGLRLNAPALLLSQEHEIETLTLEAAACLPCARVSSWNQLGDGTCNGAVWRRAWDETFPPPEVASTPAFLDPSPCFVLSPRESEILALVCRGLSNAQIAETLVIARSTAKRHVANIFAKLGVATRPQAIAFAYERGLASAHGAPPPPSSPDRHSPTG